MNLDLSTFRKANAARCEESFFLLDHWSEMEWGCALAGETGELCNLLKKRARGDSIPLKAVLDEMADIFTYLDLLAAKLGVDLSEPIREKFNEVSERWGSKIKL